MAVDSNPYKRWKSLRDTGDYRDRTTQATSLVRQQLAQQEYLRSSNRVNPGPYRNTRAKIANESPVVPHVLSPEDVWGWQDWAYNKDLIAYGTLTGLFEIEDNVPGTSYVPYENVGGASYIPKEVTYDVEISSEDTQALAEQIVL